MACRGSVGGIGPYGRLRKAAAIALALAMMLTGIAASGANASTRKHKAASTPHVAASIPHVAASIVVDMNNGAILSAADADTPRHPASLTKMMTLYVLFGYLRNGKITQDSELVVTPYAASQAPTKLGLKPGATISVNDAVKALVTQSANDAAVAIAENLAGSEENFAHVMTETARRIGMTQTTFCNASGLPNEAQITTARDIAILAAHLIHDYPEYYEVFATRYFSFAGRKYSNHNKLLFGYKGTDGIKTGYTQSSGFNLAASAHRGNKHLLAVVLGGKTGSQRDAATRALLDKHFPAASDTAPTQAQLEASLVGAPPPPLPAIKKPDLAAAASSPAPPPPQDPLVEASSPAATKKLEVAAAAMAPSFASPSAQAEGDAEGPVIKASVPAASGSTADPAVKPVRYAGAYHVQVGAFTSEAEAENRLGMVQQRALDLLDGHLPFTTSFMKGDQEWYRARFAGFSQENAQAACAALKKLSLDCAVMPAE